MNYERDVEIDETALDVEWLNQPALALRYGRNWVNASKAVALKEEEIKVCRSQLVQEANEQLDKPTAPNVEAYYRDHEKHKELKKELIELVYERDMAYVAKSEITHTRKTALENLVRLNGQSYFAGPSVPRDLEREAGVYADKQKEQQEDVDIKVGQRNKKFKRKK